MNRALAARYYTDQAIFDAELDAVFARSWVMVGHESQVATHGQVVTAAVGDESVFVVNNGGQLGAFYNVCQHRGHELFGPPQPGGEELTVPGLITCPYHAWVYALDGTLASARSRDVGEICLPPVRLERLGGVLFVNLDQDAPALAQVVPGVEA
ncbi:MAG: Rieske (2Fe-2S) protein, partial [Acidimicrobiales bacterium]|nr:Rieske (2Fe-2S) protein [Acidimicrobiales bacterium]